MGFHVSSLASLPVGTIEYFVHVVDATRGRDGDWIATNLNKLAGDFGANAGLVVGPENLSQELYTFLSKNIKKDFAPLEKMLQETTCLLISEGHLATTNRPVYLLPIATTSRNDNDANQATGALINMIAKAISNDSLEKFIESLGAHKIELSSIDASMFVCTLRNLNDFLELKPNFYGLGANLNAIIERCLPTQKRSA
jgi:hypothetical protein